MKYDKMASNQPYIQTMHDRSWLLMNIYHKESEKIYSDTFETHAMTMK